MWFYQTFRHFDAAARSGRYGCTSGPISMHEQFDIGSETRAVTDRVTMQNVTTFTKTCNKDTYRHDGRAYSLSPDLYDNSPLTQGLGVFIMNSSGLKKSNNK